MRRSLLALLALPVLLAACGGDSSEPTEAATAVPDAATDTAPTATGAAPAATAGSAATADPTAAGGTGGAVTEGTGTAGGAGGDGAGCAPAQAIADLDEETSTLTDELFTQISAAGANADPAAIDAQLAELSSVLTEQAPQVEAAYDELEATLPGDLAADAAIVRDLSLEVFGNIAEATTLEEFNAVFAAVDQAQAEEAAQATLRIDAYIQEECGFAFAAS